MKKLAYILFSVALLSSCTLQQAELEDLVVHADSRAYFFDEDIPYSGQAIEHDAEGNIKQELHYKEGLKHGAYKDYYDSQTLAARGAYKDGKLHGKWRIYYPDGKIEKELGYRNGKENGRFRWYSEEGNLMREINYVDGELHGAWKEWTHSGTLITNRFYIDGRRQ